MTTSTYRCVGCRQYRPRPEYRTIGLGCVCSEECQRAATDRRRGTPKPARTLAPDLRNSVTERDRGRCRLCGATQGLHHHHIAYRSEGGTDDERNLITLCHTHHDLVHTNKRRWQPVLFAYIRAYYGQGRRPSLVQLDRQINDSAEPVEVE